MNRNKITNELLGNRYYLIYSKAGNYYVTPSTFNKLNKINTYVKDPFNRQPKKFKLVKNIRKNPRVHKINNNLLKEGSKVGNALAKKYLEKAPLNVIAKKFYNKAMNTPNFNTFIRTRIPGRTFSNENISKIYQKMYKIASGSLRVNNNENQN